jgi:CheY-like chemotaxis protein
MNSSHSILLVEDDQNDILLLQLAFQKAGIKNKVVVVENGEQALDYLCGRGVFGDRERFPIPRLILLDLSLPLVTGLEVLQWVSTHRATAPPNRGANLLAQSS